eukprot:scaffold575656_cov34-Prasinocladus_malaysianus.AAC.1
MMTRPVPSSLPDEYCLLLSTVLPGQWIVFSRISSEYAIYLRTLHAMTTSGSSVLDINNIISYMM